MRKIKYIDLSKNFLDIKKDLFKKFNNIGKNGDFILGKYVKEFEKKLKKLTGSKYIASCGNGTDAIEISLKILNIKYGDEIITTSNTWLSVGNAILNVGAKPVFVDIDKSLNIDEEKIKKEITKKTKCIIVTHLNGLPANIKQILNIAKAHKLKVIEDCSQAIGSKYNEKHVGNFSDIATYSLHPTKNLGILGDGGFIATNNKINYNKFIIFRNNGLINRNKSKYIGRNSRLDNFQAIAGLLLLKNLNKRINKRKGNADLYFKNLKNISCIKSFPQNYQANKKHTYHRYVIECNKRNLLLNFLNKFGIEAKIHYPINIHEQLPFRKFYNKNLYLTNILKKKTISLPIHENLSTTDINYICKIIKKFYYEKTN